MILLRILFFISCLVALSLTSWGQNISTIAGNGFAGYNGDGGPATASQINGPFNIAMDAQGKLFIADRFNHKIRMIDANGIITTVAGTGIAGFGGDGSQATDAQISGPTGVAMDIEGNVYIVDHGNHCIRKVRNDGIITTIAGIAGTAGYSGDGGPAVEALLNGPRGIATDRSGDIYIADAGNHAIRKVDKDGIITTIAGNGISGYSGDGGPATDAQLYGPYSIALDAAGDLYISDVDNERIRKVSKGIITTIAGTGAAGYNGDNMPATNASLYEPIAIAADRFGNIYIADAWNSRIRYIDRRTGIITTLAGNGTRGYGGDNAAATSANFNNPYGIAVADNGDVFVADYSNNRVRKMEHSLAPEHEGITVFPNPSSGRFSVLVNANVNEQLKLIIINSQGRRVTEFSVVANTVTDIEVDLPSGLYFLSSGGNGNYHSKLLIVK